MIATLNASQNCQKKICALKSQIVTDKSALALKKKKPTKECRDKKHNTKSSFKIDCVQDQDYSNYSHRCVRFTEFDWARYQSIILRYVFHYKTCTPLRWNCVSLAASGYLEAINIMVTIIMYISFLQLTVVRAKAWSQYEHQSEPWAYVKGPQAFCRCT